MSRTLKAAQLLALLVLLVLAACGSPPPPKPPVRELPPPATALLDLAPPGYGQTAPVVLPEDQGSAAAQAAFSALAGPGAIHEPALDLVAAVVGKTYAEENELPARALLQWLYWKCGAVSLPGPVNVFVAPPEATAYFQEHVRRLAAVVPKSNEPVSFGLARIAVNGHVAQSVVLGYRLVEVAPLTKAQAAGAKVPVRLALKKPLADLTLYVDQGGASVLKLPMAKQEDGTYSAEAPLPAAPGRYFVEATGIEIPADGAVEKGWRTSLLWLPVYVGAPEPKAADEFIRHPQKNHPDRSTWPLQIISAYNSARATLGRPPLAPEQPASAIAQARSDEIASLADLPPPENQLAHRLAAAGLPARNLSGFVDQIEFVSEYITLRLLRPAARYSLFNPDVTTIALGISPRTVAPGLGLWSSVEYVFGVIHVDPPKERERILGDLDAAHGKPFTRSDPLALGAQAVADGICKGGPKPTEAHQMFARVAGLDPSLRNRLAAPWIGYDFKKEDAEAIAKDAAAYTHAGVGVCQGTIDGSPGAVLVMILFAGP
jgi:hypothetical protein